ncbi:MAG: hypothetical protein ACLUOI_23305 [Eisenbergiella sp.]
MRRSTVDFIVTGNPEGIYHFTLDPRRKTGKDCLEDFPKRPDRTTKIELSLGFPMTAPWQLDKR